MIFAWMEVCTRATSVLKRLCAHAGVYICGHAYAWGPLGWYDSDVITSLGPL